MRDLDAFWQKLATVIASDSEAIQTKARAFAEQRALYRLNATLTIATTGLKARSALSGQ